MKDPVAICDNYFKKNWDKVFLCLNKEISHSEIIRYRI